MTGPKWRLPKRLSWGVGGWEVGSGGAFASRTAIEGFEPCRAGASAGERGGILGHGGYLPPEDGRDGQQAASEAAVIAFCPWPTNDTHPARQWTSPTCASWAGITSSAPDGLMERPRVSSDPWLQALG